MGQNSNNTNRAVWKVICIVISSAISVSYIIIRKDDYIKGTDKILDIKVFCVIIILLLMQFIKEIDFGGLKLKLKEVNSNIESKILDASTRIINNISTNQQQSIIIGSEDIREAKNAIEKDPLYKRRGDIKLEALLSNDQDTYKYYLIRRTIEKEIRRIGSNYFGFSRAYNSVQENKIIDKLVAGKLLPVQFFSIYRDVKAICNNIIHGSEPDSEEEQFINESAIYILTRLKEIDDKKMLTIAST